MIPVTDDHLPALLQQYDVPIPRYTSYPTVPYWDFNTLTEEKWKQQVVKTFVQENHELSIYIHLPFCESLCTFCACNKRITKNHLVESPYIQTLLKEWQLYRSLLPALPVIREIHLGGGTPTFFSPEHLATLIRQLTAGAIISDAHEFSIEVHPNYTTEQHLQQLAALGFNRISVGVQDFDPMVQSAINRVQSFEKTKEVIDWARKHHYTSVNVDLVYGLPHQTIKSIAYTIDRIRQLSPDRIALYSYAHVPWKSKGQRRYTEDDLPAPEEKWHMYHSAATLLQATGFNAIGMDHFALPGDKLFAAAAEGKLHRNFMGYTTTRSKLIIGLGASAISDAWGAFMQNEKVVEDYERRVNLGYLPMVNGHLLSVEDLEIRQHILDLMCRHETDFTNELLDPDFVEYAYSRLRLLEGDGLVTINNAHIQVTAKGHLFIRNICAAIDAGLWRKKMLHTFSRSI
jgi:oxygen-independent coproporphyrinogen-3 oxidase